MRNFTFVPTVSSFANVTASILRAPLALALLTLPLLLPTEAAAWTTDEGYKYSGSHVTEGSSFSITIELVDAKGRSLPENTKVYTHGYTRKNYPGATAGTDYTAYDQTHTFSKVGDKITVSIPTSQDDTVEGDEQFGLVTQPGGSGNDKSWVYIRILNDDVATITISDASVNEGGTITFTAKHTGKTGGFSFNMTPSYTNGTAESGDYTTNTSDITFSGTLNEEKTFTVSTIEDAVLEENETFTVSLGRSSTNSNIPKGAEAEITGQSATGTINNDDAATVTVNDASASEGDDITFTISLNNAVEDGLTVTPSYTNGAAASGDYTQNTTGISFTGNANETKTFTVSTTEDAVLEGNETFTVGLGVSNAPSWGDLHGHRHGHDQQRRQRRGNGQRRQRVGGGQPDLHGDAVRGGAGRPDGHPELHQRRRSQRRLHGEHRGPFLQRDEG